MSSNGIVPVGSAKAGPVPPSLEPAVAFTPPAVSSLGGRNTTTIASFNWYLLREACTNPDRVFNPSVSAGVSPALRELLMETGFQFTVLRELYNDGDSNGHMGGNALDIGSDDLHALAVLLGMVPGLFSALTWTDPDYSADSLYILGGTITTSDDSGLVRLVNSSGSSMHLASSPGRFRAALSDVSVQAALEAGTSGPFTSRDVYTVDTQVMRTASDTGTVNRW